MHRPRSLQTASLVVFVAVVAAGCGGAASGTCTELREPLDPLSIQHVIDAGSATFLTDPPTSGPHIAGPAASGLLATPLTPAAQVRVLEAGGVVVQYRDEADGDAVKSLLVDDETGLVIAPDADLSSPVIATAWTWKLTCDTVDLDTIREFVDSRAGGAPGED